MPNPNTYPNVKTNGGGGSGSVNTRTTNVNMADGGGRAGATQSGKGPSEAKLAEVEQRIRDRPDPPPNTNYTGGGGTPTASAEAAPSVDTTANPYTNEGDAAAATTQRLTNAVDMSEKIAAANDAWSQATQNYGQQSGQMIDQFGRNQQNTINQYGQNVNNLTDAYASAAGQATTDYGQQSGQNIDQYQQNAQDIIRQLSGISAQELADYAASTGQTIDQATRQINDILAGLQENLKPAEIGRIDHVDTTEQENLLKELSDAQRQQAAGQIDYAVNEGINELNRALEDAAPQFQEQRNQIAGAERTARDNSALYSEMRGDRGGIGKANYDAIANTAATNQLTVNQAQTKLSTDTARQIADLRAKGEFDKADKYLQISQEYLKGLMDLKQWATETNLGVDEFNIAVDQWVQEFNSETQQILGDLGMRAVEYTTGLNLDRQNFLTDASLRAAQNEANLGLESAGKTATLRESNLSNIADMIRSNAYNEAQMRSNNEKSIAEMRSNLDRVLTDFGLSNAQYMTNNQVQQLTDILSAYQENARNMTNTEINAASLTGSFGDKTQTMAAKENQASRLASAATQMIQSGITPTDAQLNALGWNRDQYDAYKSLLDAAAAAASRGGGGRRSSTFLSDLRGSIEAGVPTEQLRAIILQYEAGGNQSAADIKTAYDLVDKAEKIGYGTKYGSGQNEV